MKLCVNTSLTTKNIGILHKNESMFYHHHHTCSANDRKPLRKPLHVFDNQAILLLVEEECAFQSHILL